jgi:hypothetical protein
MHILKSVGVMSFAKLAGLIYGCLGLIFVPFFLLFAVIGSFAGQDKLPFAGIFGILFAILMPILYGAMGFVMGAISALLYNVMAKWAGGLELELELRPATSAPPYPLIPPATPSV